MFFLFLIPYLSQVWKIVAAQHSVCVYVCVCMCVWPAIFKLSLEDCGSITLCVCVLVYVRVYVCVSRFI